MSEDVPPPIEPIPLSSIERALTVIPAPTPPGAAEAHPPSPATASPDSPGKPYLRLGIISFLLLFFELACIRWFGSTVVFLTFFTNIVLIASFLGMSVGLLTAKRPVNFIRSALPLAATACALSAVLLFTYNHYPRLLMIDVGHQKESPQQIFFGTEYYNRDITKVVIPMWAIAGLFFTLIATMFIGIGQEMGRAFDLIPNRLAAYTADIIGSLAGILMFSVLSYAWTPPAVWFGIIAVLLIYLLPRFTRAQALSLVVLVGVVCAASYQDDLGKNILWSPYYKIEFNRGNDQYYPERLSNNIETNNIGHQQMADFNIDELVYPLPHVIARDAGLPPYKKVLIIGAGSGNDVTAALHHGVEHIDAVEIDPAINYLGRQFHPNRPYDDARVASSIHLTDGRQWLKRNATNEPNHYDLGIYALVDSLVLHSGYSSLRLESFLFTREAFDDMKANLNPGGVFVMYNYYRQPWVIGRLNAIAEDVFKTKPLVISFPAKDQDVITDTTRELNQYTMLMVGLPDDPKDPNSTNARVETIRKKLAASANTYFVPSLDAVEQITNGFDEKHQPTLDHLSPEQAAAMNTVQWRMVKPSIVNVATLGPLPTDDWPQLYLRDKILPPESIQSMTVIGVLSILLLAVFAPRQSRVPNGRMFFLGAGFMLLECKGVVHLSLLFGATWITNSVVFFSILVMVLLANLFVLAFKPKKLTVYYALLFATLAVNGLVPMASFLTLPGLARPIVSCAVIFVPVFFAGVIFGTTFRDSDRPDSDLGWNIAGIILGALAENLSVVIGFKALIGVAIVFYACSMVFGRRPTLRAV